MDLPAPARAATGFPHRRCGARIGLGVSHWRGRHCQPLTETPMNTCEV
jgi:hypothetical protein